MLDCIFRVLMFSLIAAFGCGQDNSNEERVYDLQGSTEIERLEFSLTEMEKEWKAGTLTNQRWFHNRRLQWYGAMIRAYAKKGNFPDDIAKKMERAYQDATHSKTTINEGITGLVDIVRASEQSNRLKVATKWQERVIVHRSDDKIAEGYGLWELAEFYVALDKKKKAKETLRLLLGCPNIEPISYFKSSYRFFQMGEIGEARSILESGKHRYEQALKKAKRLFETYRVFVLPRECDGIPRDLWYPIGKWRKIAGTANSEIDQLLKKGYVDITLEAKKYEIEKAQSHQAEMEEYYEKAMSKLPNTQG